MKLKLKYTEDCPKKCKELYQSALETINCAIRIGDIKVVVEKDTLRFDFISDESQLSKYIREKPYEPIHKDEVFVDREEFWKGN